jgi:hypothetical protein
MKKIKDLTPTIEFIEEVLKLHFGTEENIGMSIAYTLPPDYDGCHWITNLSREDGIKLFKETAEKMQAQIN